jgi:hypothetical protein
MRDELSIRIRYKKRMRTSDGIELPVHLQKLLTTNQWGAFGDDDDSHVAALIEEIFEGDLFDIAGETFRVIDVGEVEVTVQL